MEMFLEGHLAQENSETLSGGAIAIGGGGGGDTPPIVSPEAQELYQQASDVLNHIEELEQVPHTINGQPLTSTPVKALPAATDSWWERVLGWIRSDWFGGKAADLALKAGGSVTTAARTGQFAGFVPIFLGIGGAAAFVYLFTHRSKNVSA